MKRRLFLLLSFIAICAFGQKSLVITTKDGGKLETPVTRISQVSISNQRSLTAYLWGLANSNKVAVMAHRCNTFTGVRNGIPENSLPALDEAVKAGADFIEIDPWKTKDGIIVINHDNTIDNATSGSGKIADLTYDQIEQYHLLDGDGEETEYTIPKLSEMLDAAKGKVFVNIDLGKANVSLMNDIVKIVKEKDMQDEVCYFTNSIKTLRETDPTAILFPWVSTPNDVDQATIFYDNLKFVQFEYKASSIDEMIKVIRNNHLVGEANILNYDSDIMNNKFDKLDEFTSKGVQCIQTDYCDLVIKHLQEKGLR